MSKPKAPAKTNAMRELDAAGVAYATHEYDPELVEGEYGVAVAAMLGQDPDRVFKTLVTVAPDGDHVVCCVPVAFELDLKKAATAAGKKSLALIHVKELEPLTGYVRGGCSPVGMRKRFSTIIDEIATMYDTICVSGGRRGCQIEIDPSTLADHVGARVADIVREDRL